MTVFIFLLQRYNPWPHVAKSMFTLLTYLRDVERRAVPLRRPRPVSVATLRASQPTI